MLGTFFPGESARLLSIWNGLDSAAATPHPLMGFFARPFGLTNGLAPVLGVLAVLALGFLTSRLVRRATRGEDTAVDAAFAGRLAGIAAALSFLLSSEAISAATHVEPALFSLVATLGLALALAGALAVRSGWSYLLLLGVGVLSGFFAGECPLVTACAPLAAWALVRAVWHRARVSMAFGAFALFAVGFAGGFFLYAGTLAPDVSTALVEAKHGLLGQLAFADGGGSRAVFAALPFLVALALLPRAFGDGARKALTTIGEIALLILAAFGLFRDFAETSATLATSVASAAFASFVCGEVVAYFAVTSRADRRTRAPEGTRLRNFKFVSRALLGGLLAVFAVAAAIRAVTDVDTSYSFADRVAGRVLDALGSRTWLVTDGRLDSHLRLLAARCGRDVSFVDISRDLDPAAQKALRADVERRFGDRAPALLRSLDLGTLPFLEDWVGSDPAATNSIAVMAAPDILAACGLACVPEVYLFGADPQAPADWSVWTELAELLPAEKGWGSVNLFALKERDPLAYLRLNLRRFLGLVANNRGVWLQDRGDREGAFRLYTLVLDEIDADNVSALFNALAMAEDGFGPAVARKRDFQKKMKAIVADETRRYRLWALANYYGTIRNVPALLSRGYAWASSGRPGAALAQIRRAIDLVPSDKRGNLMNMMAALLADANQREQSRRVYERRLEEKSDDHGALMGLVRLELLAGNEAQAQAYLARAVAAGGDDPRVQTELAMLAMMKGDAARAREILKAVTAADAKNLKAWSMLAAVTMQLSDAAKDPAARAALDRELEEKILPAMKTHARGDESYYVHSAQAFLALRKGEAGRKAARASLMAAVQARPDAPVMRELLIGMDVALNDPVAAEANARRTLRQDRNSPMANYVMGSLALGKNDLANAEAYLRVAVAAKKPSAYALNDLAETLRLAGRPAEGEPFARRVVKEYPGLYAGWDTLACIILDSNGSVDEALACSEKAVKLVTRDGRAQDAGVLVTLARAQAKKGDRRSLRVTLRKLEDRQGELNDRQRRDLGTLRVL